MQDIEKIFEEAGELRARLIETKNIDNILKKLLESRTELKFDSETPFSSVCKQAGIYFIEAKFPFSTERELTEFGEAWGMAKGKKVVSECPRFYKGRVKPHLPLLNKSEYVPFYLGKQQDVQMRLSLHLNDAINSTTYGLKLKARHEILKNIAFRFSWITFNTTTSNYFCVELIEAAIREKLSPIIGKQ